MFTKSEKSLIKCFVVAQLIMLVITGCLYFVAYSVYAVKMRSERIKQEIAAEGERLERLNQAEREEKAFQASPTGQQLKRINAFIEGNTRAYEEYQRNSN